jgi:GNAT superfamily N-acetyltransferase
MIRDAREDELTNIRELRVQAYEEHAPRIPKEHWEGLKRMLSSEADTQPGVEHIVAGIDGKIVGTVLLFPARTDAYGGQIEELEYPEIRMLAVSPETRGRGVATSLIAECINRTKARGFHSIGLHTGDFMETAMKLYESLGFKRQPQFDFEPAADGIIVKAYRLSFD